MPKPQTVGYDQAYIDLRRQADQLGDKMCCAVIAVAAVTGASFELTQQAFIRNGRKPGKRTKNEITQKVLQEFGYAVEEVNREVFFARYPTPHNRALKNITTHHPERFNAAWKDGETYLLWSDGHISAVIDGALVDHAVGHKRRVVYIGKVVKR